MIEANQALQGPTVAKKRYGFTGPVTPVTHMLNSWLCSRCMLASPLLSVSLPGRQPAAGSLTRYALSGSHNGVR